MLTKIMCTISNTFIFFFTDMSECEFDGTESSASRV